MTIEKRKTYHTHPFQSFNEVFPYNFLNHLRCTQLDTYAEVWMEVSRIAVLGLRGYDWVGTWRGLISCPLHLQFEIFRDFGVWRGKCGMGKSWQDIDEYANSPLHLG